jgi:hypothetical protein
MGVKGRADRVRRLLPAATTILYLGRQYLHAAAAAGLAQ